jgi:hypothetical protein
MPMTDHHDIAGVPHLYGNLALVLGTEYRPQIWINILNRIRLLECQPKSIEVE